MIVKIDDAFSIIRNGANIKQGSDDSGYPITRIETIANRVVDRNKMGYAGIKTIAEYQDYILQDGDILMSHINSEKHLGKVAIYDKQENEIVIHGMNLLCLRPKTEILNSRYAFYYLSSEMFLRQLPNITKKSVNQASFNITSLKELMIPIVSMELQLNIVDVLDKLQALIGKLKYQLIELDKLVKSRFIELFGDPVSNPMGWNKKTLKEVCVKLNDGTHFSPESFDTGEYKYVTAKNIKINGFDFSNISYVPEETHRPIYERCNPEKGDVLYIKDGATTGIAMVNTLEEEFTLLSSVALLKQDRSVINGYFLAATLNDKNMYSNIRSNMGGAAITRLTIAKLNSVKVIVPPLELQQQFATFVAEVDKSKLAVQQSLQELELLKKSLMQQYFG